MATQAHGTSCSPLFLARRLRRSAVLLLAIASPVHFANAQASSNELFAAYCLGVFEQRLKDGLASGLEEEAARQQAQPVRRVYQYLKIAIGTATATAPLAALSAVQQGGMRDQSACMSGIEANFTRAPAQCLETCLAPIQDYQLCISCVPSEVEPEACKRVLRCKPAPLPQPPRPVSVPAVRVAPQQVAKPVPIAVQPQRQSMPSAAPSNSQAQQHVTAVPTASRPEARPPVVRPPAPARREASPAEQIRPAGHCAVSRPKPGLQVYLVECPGSWAMIGRTVDLPTAWTVSEGVNEGEAVEFFMKSRHER